MARNLREILRHSLPIALATMAVLTCGITGCGSDDSEPTASGGSGYSKQPVGTTGNASDGEVTPDAEKPASAGDKKKNAPDRAISKRPGGPDSAPTSP